MPEKPNGDNHENYEPDVEDLHDIVEFNRRTDLPLCACPNASEPAAPLERNW